MSLTKITTVCIVLSESEDTGQEDSANVLCCKATESWEIELTFFCMGSVAKTICDTVKERG